MSSSNSPASLRILPRGGAFLALGCAGLLGSVPAMAADTSADADMGGDQRTIIVNGQKTKTEVDSPKATAPLLDTPQTVTVISDQTLRKQNLLTLRDALQTIPGITFGAGEGGGGYGDKINLRGFSADSDITIDGIRDTAQYTRSDPFNLQQIEVYNGANSVANGSGSVGGTINLVSKSPQARDLTILQAGIGTDDYYRATLDTNHRLSDLIAVRLNAMYHSNDVPGRDLEEYERWGVAPSITIGVNGPNSLTIAYLHQSDDNVPIYGVPYFPIAGGPLGEADDSDYFGIANLDRQQLKLDRLTATFAHDFGGGITIRNLTRYQRVHQPTQTSAPQGDWCLSTGLTPFGVACAAGQQPGFFYPRGPRGRVRDQTNDLLVNQTDLRVVSGEDGGMRNTLVVGATFSQEDYRLVNGELLRNPGGAQPNPVQPPINIANPDTVWRGPINRIVNSKSYGDAHNAAVYAFDTLELSPMFEINLGARYESMHSVFRVDDISTPVTGAVVTRGADQISDENLFSYRGGFVFKPAQNASLYISYSNSKTPSSASVRDSCVGRRSGNFCDVAPETGKSYEIGGKIDLLGSKLQLTAAIFRNDHSNYRVASNDPALPTTQVLDGHSRVDGIALGATGNITPAWSIFANYTYLDSTILQGTSDFCLANPGTATCDNSIAVPDPLRGNDLQQTPTHSGSLFTTYSFPFGLQIGYGLTYQGSFAVNQSSLAEPRQFRSDDYLTQRLFVSYAFDNGLTAQLNVQNLANARYFTNIRNNGWATPGEDRSAVFSLFYSF